MKTGKRAAVSILAVIMCFAGFALTGCGDRDTSAEAEAYAQKTEAAVEVCGQREEKTEEMQEAKENSQETSEKNDASAETNQQTVAVKATSTKETNKPDESKESAPIEETNSVESDSKPIDNTPDSVAETVNRIDCSSTWEYTTEYFDTKEQYNREATVRGTGSIRYVNSEKFEANGRAIVIVHFSEDVDNSYMKNPDGSDVTDAEFIDNHKFMTSICMGERSQTVVNKDTGETEYLDIKDPNLCTLDEELFVPMKAWMIAEGAKEEYFSEDSLSLMNEPGWTVNFGNHFDGNGHVENFCFYELQRTDADVTIGVEMNQPTPGGSMINMTPAAGSTQKMTLSF